MKTNGIILLLIASLWLCCTVRAQVRALTNHADAITFLDEFQALTDTNFNANLPFQDHYHFDGGQKLLAYMRSHTDDTNVVQRVITLAKSWANMERANEEMKRDRGSRLAWLWLTRTLFAWTILTKHDVIREGMMYEDAVSLLGRPRNPREILDTETEVMWVLGASLRTQTWIRATVDKRGMIRKLVFRRT